VVSDGGHQRDRHLDHRVLRPRGDRAAPRRPPVDDDLLAHIWPSHHSNVNFYGTHSVDIDGELAKLDADGYRPLRLPGVAAAARG
jgi:hypothetical protein